MIGDWLVDHIVHVTMHLQFVAQFVAWFVAWFNSTVLIHKFSYKPTQLRFFTLASDALRVQLLPYSTTHMWIDEKVVFTLTCATE